MHVEKVTLHMTWHPPLWGPQAVGSGKGIATEAVPPPVRDDEGDEEESSPDDLDGPESVNWAIV